MTSKKFNYIHVSKSKNSPPRTSVHPSLHAGDRRIRKKLDENDLVQKWPTRFRDGIKMTYHDIGVLDVIIHGETDISPKDLEEMKKFGYIFDGIRR